MRMPLVALLLALATSVGAIAQERRIDLANARITPAEAKPGDVVTIAVDVTPHDGWHLYGKLETTGQPPTIAPGAAWLEPKGEAEFPDGDEHEAFGLVSYWIDTPFTITRKFVVGADAPTGAQAIRPALHYMACTEQTCDQPTSEPFAVALTVAAAPAPAAGEWIDVAHEGRVSIKVRVVPARARAGQTIKVEASLTIEDGWHVYGKLDPSGEHPKIEPADAPAWFAATGETAVDDGEEHDAFGIKSYWLEFEAAPSRSFRVQKGAPVGTATIPLTISYMACNDQFCEPKMVVPVSLPFEIEAGEAAATDAEEDPPAATPAKPAPAKPDARPTVSGAQDLDRMSIWEIVLASILAGLFALVMPCTYPMIPITMSFFTKQADQRGGNVLPLALVYGAGIIVIFTVIGALAAPIIVPFAQHPVTNLVIGIAFLVFGVSLFGLIDLRPPQFLMNTAAKASAKGGLMGVFLMGATLVVTSFTCTAPFVGTLIAGAAKSGLSSVILGMAIFGLTMAIPFVLLALLPGQLKAMPKSGSWMNSLKVFFGFVEVAAALKFFSNTDLVWNKTPWLPRELFLMLWAAIFFCAALYLFGFVKLKGESGEIGPGRMLAAIGTFCLAAYFTHGAMGYKLDNFIMLAMEPPKRSTWTHGSGGSTTTTATAPATPQIIPDDYDKALALAKQQGKKLFVNFTGHT